MKYSLSYADRMRIRSTLTDKQNDYLDAYLKKGQQSVFGEVLARSKGKDFDGYPAFEDQIEKWELLEIVDAGPNYRKCEPKLKCECGRVVRYQYRVVHKETGCIHFLGSTHFEDHLGFPPQVVKDIVQGIHHIHYELDEILSKIDSAWEMPFDFQIPISIPEEIKTHMDLGLPLLNRQINKLERLIREWVRVKKYNRNTLTSKENTSTKDNRSIMDSKFIECVDRCLNEGFQSALKISEALVLKYGYSDIKVNGKPESYSNVVMYLKTLCDQKKCIREKYTHEDFIVKCVR